MSGSLTHYDPESTDPNIKSLSCLAKRCWSPFAIIYDPLKAGSIDGTDSQPHDKAIARAQTAIYKPSPKAKGDPKCTIFISGVSRKSTEKDLKEVFSRFGEIIRCRIIRNIVTGRSRGYAFIEFSSKREALDAYKKANKIKLHDTQLFVDMECSRTLPGWVPRRLGGGFNGRKESGQLRFGGRQRPFKKPLHLLSQQEILHQLEEKLKKPLEEKIGKETTELS